MKGTQNRFEQKWPRGFVAKLVDTPVAWVQNDQFKQNVDLLGESKNQREDCRIGGFTLEALGVFEDTKAGLSKLGLPTRVA